VVGSTNLIIVNPSTAGQAGMNQLGEIWIEKSSPCISYESAIGGSCNFADENSRLHSKVKTSGFKNETFINTGLLGFLKAPDNAQENPNLFIIGRRDEKIIIRGMSFQPQEIESSVLRSHRFEFWFE